MAKDKKDKGRRPFRITPEDAKAEGERLRERLDAADREDASLFASQLADGELVSDEATMSCAEWERLLDDLEVDMTDEQARDWCAHAELCPGCGEKQRQLEPENLDPRIARFLSDKGYPEKGIPSGREMARRIWEQVHGKPSAPPAEAL